MISLRVLAIFAVAFALALAAPVKQESYQPSVRYGVVTTPVERAEKSAHSSSMPSIRIGVVPPREKRAEKPEPSSSMPSVRYGVVSTPVAHEA